MNTADKIKRLFSRSNVKVRSEYDEEVLSNTFCAFEKSMNRKSEVYRPNFWRIVVKRRLVCTTVALAAIIVLFLCLYAVLDNDKLQRGNDATVYAVRSQTPAELVSVISLSRAYRDGGMEAIEQQFEKAQEKVWPALRESVEVDRLMSEL